MLLMMPARVGCGMWSNITQAASSSLDGHFASGDVMKVSSRLRHSLKGNPSVDCQWFAQACVCVRSLLLTLRKLPIMDNSRIYTMFRSRHDRVSLSPWVPSSTLYLNHHSSRLPSGTSILV